MAVVLNQADLLAPPQTGAWRDHARELLAHDGLRDVPLLVVSAQSGEGVDGLRRLLAERVAARDAALARLAGDASAAAAELAAACAGEAAPASDVRIAPVSSPPSRMPSGCPTSCGPSRRPTVAAGRSRPAGRPSAGSAGCGRTRFVGSASQTAGRRNCAVVTVSRSTTRSARRSR